MKGLADYFYEACCLHEFESLDPEDSVAVLRYAFLHSHCSDFALALHKVTGWPVEHVTSKKIFLHALVRSPDGALLDASGWVTEKGLRKQYKAAEVSFEKNVGPLDRSPLIPTNETARWVHEDLQRLIAVVRILPVPPFTEDWFRRASCATIPGIDVPSDGDSQEFWMPSACLQRPSSRPQAALR